MASSSIIKCHRIFWSSIILIITFAHIVDYVNGQKRVDCPHVPINQCCTAKWTSECAPKHCYRQIIAKCPDKTRSAFSRTHPIQTDKRRAPIATKRRNCGTEEFSFAPCLSKTSADELFQSCCQQYVPTECLPMCFYETDADAARKTLVDVVESSRCDLKHLSAVLYCASQNRDNRACCRHLGLNADDLNVGGRCLRMCDPSGSPIDTITKDDVTCLYNFNVILFCHHSGVRMA